jgi:pyruvate dehydrogenase E1 component beta subunit
MLKPMDINTVAESVRKTGRLVTVSEGFGTCGAGREITGQLMEYEFSDGSRGFDYLDAAAVNLAAAEWQVSPASRKLLKPLRQLYD